MTTPPATQPTQLSQPATALSSLESATSWPARMASAPNHSSPVIDGAHARGRSATRGSRRPCAGRAPRRARGSADRPTSASTSEPDPADPDPPPGAQPVAVAQPGGADGRARADVRGEKGREQQARPERAAGHEEVARPADAPRDVQADGNLRGGEGERGGTQEVHRGGAVRQGCRGCELSAKCKTRSCGV